MPAPVSSLFPNVDVVLFSGLKKGRLEAGTGAGKIAFRFLADPGTGSLVRQVPDAI